MIPRYSSGNSASVPLSLLKACGLVAVIFAFASALDGCGRTSFDNTLADSSELGNPRGLKIARAITHYHSVYSYDACDKNGVQDGVPNAACLSELRSALCANRVNFLFLTDHPDNMGSYEMKDLLLASDGDQLLTGTDGVPYANQLGGCPSGFTPTIMAGFEGKLLAMGMARHLTGTAAERTATYGANSRALRDKLAIDANAIVMIPHTESRTVAEIEALAPDGIEIYNVHANLDPKIRKRDLNLPPFEQVSKILSYLVDPYSQLNADLVFMQFFAIDPSYFQKWDQLIQDGYKVAGIGGSDSHENIFPQKVSDGERMDSYRRMTRFMSNHLLVNSLSVADAKDSLKRGRGWLVMEGLGTPVGMDFSATTSTGVVGVGESGALAGTKATVTITAPKIHPRFPQGQETPTFRIDLKKVQPGGKDTVVASTAGSDLVYDVTAAGAYRAEVRIVPRHLRPYLSSYSKFADEEYIWIVTNHIYLTN